MPCRGVVGDLTGCCEVGISVGADDDKIQATDGHVVFCFRLEDES